MNVSVRLCAYVSACMRACMHATVVRSQCACNIVPATFVSPLIKVSLSIFVQLLSIFVQCHGAPAITTVLVIIQPLSFLCTPSRRALRVAISPRCSPLPSGCSANLLLIGPRACPSCSLADCRAASSGDRSCCSAMRVSTAAVRHPASQPPASRVAVRHLHAVCAGARPAQLSQSLSSAESAVAAVLDVHHSAAARPAAPAAAASPCAPMRLMRVHKSSWPSTWGARAGARAR